MLSDQFRGKCQLSSNQFNFNLTLNGQLQISTYKLHLQRYQKAFNNCIERTAAKHLTLQIMGL